MFLNHESKTGIGTKANKNLIKDRKGTKQEHKKHGRLWRANPNTALTATGGLYEGKQSCGLFTKDKPKIKRHKKLKIKG